MLLPVGAALWALRRVSRSARPVRGAGLAALEEAKAACGERKTVQLGESDMCEVPMTFGVWRPRIVVPANSEGWPAARRRAILLHEVAHVRRHDLAMMWLGQVARALYWFHPLAWLAYARLGSEAEKACDDIVVNSGADAPAYATLLLETAAEMRRQSIVRHAVLHMSRQSTLEARVRRVLEAGCRRGADRRWLTVAVAVLLIALGLGGLRAAEPRGGATTVSTQPGVETKKADGEFYVMGVPRAGVYTLTADKKIGVVEALSSAGLKTEDAKNATVTLVRQQTDGSEMWQILSLAELLGGARQDVLLQPHDLLVLERTGANSLPIVPAEAELGSGEPGEYYISGVVSRPGVYTLTGRKITIKQALASAGVALEKAQNLEIALTRRSGNMETTFRVNLAALFGGKEADRFLQANDILRVWEKPAVIPATDKVEEKPAALPAAAVDAQDWRAAFDAVYSLKEGENLKFIPPGSVPARGRYFSEVEHEDHPMPCIQWRWINGAIKREMMSAYGPAGVPLAHVLETCAGLDPFHTAVDVGAVNCDGDWIVRDGATTEAILKDLQAILLEQFKIEVLVEKADMVKDAYVVKGDYKFRKLATAPDIAVGGDMLVLADVMVDVEPGVGGHIAGGGGDQKMAEFWAMVGYYVGVPIVDEEKNEPNAVNYLLSFSLMGANKDSVKRQLVLDNISKQTGLSFVPEKRTFSVWKVTRGAR
jgi:protein involved in polysaccharide export with SLBB domain